MSLPSTNPVSIIIPVHNKWELTRACLLSIRTHTPPESCEVIVMDNGSTDGTGKGITSDFPWVRYLHHPTALSFSHANNIAFKECRHELVLFLNNDTEVTPGWLKPLVEMLLSSDDIAAVGPKLLFPNGTIQHAGVIFSFLNLGYHYGAHWPGDHPEVNKNRDFKVLTGACLLCRAREFKTLGGFCEEYHTGTEDVDLCLRWSLLRKKRLVYVPASTVIHHEGQSPGRNTHLARNEQVFLEKWASLVEQDDLTYWQQTRMPQKGVSTIAVVAFAGEDPGSFNLFMNMLFRSSWCALPILVIYPVSQQKNYQHLSRYEPLITIASGNEAERVLQEWVPCQRQAIGFAGYMVFHDMVRLFRGWDEVMQHFQDQESVLVPPASHIGGIQGWIRFLANLPPSLREESLKIPSVIGATYRNIAIYKNEPLVGNYYVPAPVIDASTLLQKPGDLCKKNRRSPIPFAVVPMAMGWMGQGISGGIPAIPGATIITACRMIDDTFEKFLEQLLSGIPAEVAEVVVAAYGCPRPDTAVLKRILDNNRTVVLWCESIADPLTALNRAACVSISPYLVIMEYGLVPAQNWFLPLLRILDASDAVAATIPVIIPNAASPADDNTRKPLRCYALRRGDFIAAGGLPPAHGIPGAFDVLLERIRTTRPEGTVTVSNSHLFESTP